MKSFATVSLALLLVASLFVPQAFAYSLSGYKLINGVKNQTYYVDSNNPLYSNITAAMSNWNTIDPTYITPTQFSSTDVSFTRSSSTTGTSIDFYTADLGNTGWFGFTYYFNSSGADNPGGYPTNNYTYCQVKLNTWSGYSMNNTWTGIAAHETGHAFGLKHYDGNGSLMDSNIAYMTSPTTITNDDISGVRSTY